MRAFASLPDDLAYAFDPEYLYTYYVGGHDMVEGGWVRGGWAADELSGGAFVMGGMDFLPTVLALERKGGWLWNKPDSVLLPYLMCLPPSRPQPQPGLYKAVDLFTSYTISRFEAVKRLHIILLAITLVGLSGYVLLLFRCARAPLFDGAALSLAVLTSYTCRLTQHNSLSILPPTKIHP